MTALGVSKEVRYCEGPTLAVLGELRARMDNRGSGQSSEVILGEWSRQPSHLNDSCPVSGVPVGLPIKPFISLSVVTGFNVSV